MSNAVSIFISYSHRDERFLRQLETHLALLWREGIIEAWHDRRIGAGEEWQGAIESQLDSSRMVLFLVSADFLASDFCYGEEMDRVLRDHETGRIRAVPIILRPVDWETSPLARFQALPKDAKPLTKWRDRDEAWRSVAKGIRAAVQAVRPAEEARGPSGRRAPQPERVTAPVPAQILTGLETVHSPRYTPRQALYAKFWARLVERVAEQRPYWTRRVNLQGNTVNWLDFPSALRPAYYAMSFARGRRLRHELYIDLGTSEASAALYNRLFANREPIEQRYGRALTWEPLPGRIACRIADYADGDITESPRHEEFIAWFLDSGDRLRRALDDNPMAVSSGQRASSEAAGAAPAGADIEVEPLTAFAELTAYMDTVARDLGLMVRSGSTGRNYQPKDREPGVTYVSGIGVYSSGRGAEFNLSPFRDVGEDSVADDLLRRIREVTGVHVTAPLWPAVPCESLIKDWSRTKQRLIEPYFQARSRLRRS
jgi:hypothetical protein